MTPWMEFITANQTAIAWMTCVGVVGATISTIVVACNGAEVLKEFAKRMGR